MARSASIAKPTMAVSRFPMASTPISSLSCTASAALMVCRNAGVPPSSRSSMSSTNEYWPQGFVHATVPPPASSGTVFR